MKARQLSKHLRALERMSSYDQLAKYMRKLIASDGILELEYYDHRWWVYFNIFSSFSADSLTRQAERLARLLEKTAAMERAINTLLATLSVDSSVTTGVMSTYLQQTHGNMKETAKNVIVRLLTFDWSTWRQRKNVKRKKNDLYSSLERIVAGITAKLDDLEMANASLGVIYADISELVDNNTGARHAATEAATQELLDFTRKLLNAAN